MAGRDDLPETLAIEALDAKLRTLIAAAEDAFRVDVLGFTPRIPRDPIDLKLGDGPSVGLRLAGGTGPASQPTTRRGRGV